MKHFTTFILIFIFIGFSANLSAKSLINQIKEDRVKVVIDYSAIINKQLIEQDICQNNYTPTKFNTAGEPVKMLGYANVYMGAGPGISKFGHLAERFVYCIGNQLNDIYFDGVKLSKDALPFFTNDYPNASEEYLNSKKVIDAIYYRKLQNPTQVSIYGNDTVLTNRNIYEQWLSLTENEILTLLIKNIERIERQNLLVNEQKELPRFMGLLNNCTYQVTEDLISLPRIKNLLIPKKNNNSKDINDDKELLIITLNSVIPKSVYFALTESNLTKLLVIYPSQENMRTIYFNKLSFEKSIKLLEVPTLSLNPKFAQNWNEFELNSLRTELTEYQSPLAKLFN
jgi:hypothetical protein